MEFPEILKAYRTQEQLSQKALADKIGVSQSAVYYWEQGERSPSIDAIRKLADVFKISPNHLMGSDIHIERPPQLTGNRFPVPPAYRITDIMVTLNETGQGKVIDYASDLSKIPEYQAAAAPDPEDREPPETEKDPHI